MNEINIANQALIAIGAETITSLDQDSQEARLINEIFYSSLNTLLQEHPWNFALKRVRLSRLSETPVYGYTYAYQLPSDCLRVIEFEEYDEGYDLIVEDEKVLTDLSIVRITYIRELTDMNKLSPMFRQAFISYLAAQLAPYLTNTAPYAQGASQQFMLYMRKAKAYNARENVRYKSSDGTGSLQELQEMTLEVSYGEASTSIR